MTERSVTHATFVIERTYPAVAGTRVPRLADPAAKSRWFVGPEEWEVRENSRSISGSAGAR